MAVEPEGAGGGFEPQQRARLMRLPGIGPGVIGKLEAVGVRCIDELAHRGVSAVVNDICRQGGGAGWATRRRALQRGLIALTSDLG